MNAVRDLRTQPTCKRASGRKCGMDVCVRVDGHVSVCAATRAGTRTKIMLTQVNLISVLLVFFFFFFFFFFVNVQHEETPDAMKETRLGPTQFLYVRAHVTNERVNAGTCAHTFVDSYTHVRPLVHHTSVHLYACTCVGS